MASGSGMPILMLTAADRLDEKASGFGVGADDYLTKPFELPELVLRLRALDRRRDHHRPPVRRSRAAARPLPARGVAGRPLRPVDPQAVRGPRGVRRAPRGGVVSAEELLERAWDENADPFTNAVRITVSGLRKRLGEPWVVATVPGVGYRIDTDRQKATLAHCGRGQRGRASRLRLALSYAGLLLVAGRLLVAVVWVFLLRYVPDAAGSRSPGPFSPAAGGPAGPPSPRGHAGPDFFLLALGLGRAAGSSPVRMLAPLPRIAGATRPAGSGSLSHRIGLNGRRDEFRELADAFDGMLARLEAHVAEQRALRRQRLPRAAHAAGDHADAARASARKDPDRDDDALLERLQVVNSRGHRSRPRRCSLLSRARPRVFAGSPVDLSLLAEEATETLLSLAEERGVGVAVSGDAGRRRRLPRLLLQVATNLVHNAVVHNLPGGGRVRVTTGVPERGGRR